jgi:cell division protein FtsX
MNKVLIFLLGLPLGMVLMIFRYKIVQFTGKLEWAEQKLGAGGTYTLMIIMGFVVWIGCLMYSLGTLDDFFLFLAKFL